MATAKTKAAIQAAAAAVAAIPAFTAKTFSNWDDSKSDAENIAANASVSGADLNSIGTALQAVVTAFNELTGEDLVTSADLAPYAKTADLPDFTTFALKTEIPDTDSFATKAELGDYAKSAEVTTAISNASVTALEYTYTETTFEPKALTATKGDASTITGTLTPEAAG